jgi:hypothetical protein
MKGDLSSDKQGTVITIHSADLFFTETTSTTTGGDSRGTGRVRGSNDTQKETIKKQRFVLGGMGWIPKQGGSDMGAMNKLGEC